MDLVRLGLERATTAGEAVEVITRALARYGQGGDCGYLKPSYYHNSFIIADAHEAFVLETVDREWLVERARGVRTISNRYSIEQQADRISGGLPALLRGYGWTESADSNYAELIADPDTAHIGNARARQACSTGLLQAQNGRLTVAAMIGTLRHHGIDSGNGVQWRPECIAEGALCMHAGSEGHPAQTVGSMVSEIRSGNAVHWVTGTAAPCISLFKPVLMDTPLPVHGPRPAGQFDARTLWWRHERLHRMVVRRDFGRFVDDIRAQRDSLEADFRDRLHRVVGSDDPQERTRVIAQCWQDAAEMEEQWYLRIRHGTAAAYDSRAAVVAGWDQMSVLAAMDLE
jgi:dipeptidase